MVKADMNEKCDNSKPCPISECLKFLAGAWTHEIIWNLSKEAKRFGELKRALGTVSAKVLADRLKDMEEKGIITRTVLPTTPPQVEYRLTDFGHEFEPVFAAMIQVAKKLPKQQKKLKNKETLLNETVNTSANTAALGAQ